MYKVFVNDIPIVLSTKEDLGEKYTSIPLEVVKLKKLIKKVQKGKLRNINLYHEKPDQLLKILQKKIPTVIAGGGLVKNAKGEVLFIYRNGKWDLPKGKAEKGEGLKVCAMREVEEETGVKDLVATKLLRETYHIFKRGGKYQLKVTYWYEMTTDYTGPFYPEEKEGITKVRWKSGEKLRKALTKSYANIKLLFDKDDLPGETKEWVA